MSHQNKYLKYKKKYLDLKTQIGGCRDKILASQSKRLELKEEKEREREAKECELKERELQAKEKELRARELQAREKELRERELQAREKELRERELQAREKELRERELQARELQARELQGRELQARELQAKELQARELQAKELQARTSRERELEDRRQADQRQTDRHALERPNIYEDIQTDFSMTDEEMRTRERRAREEKRWNKPRENYASRFHKYTKESWIFKEQNNWEEFLNSDRAEFSPYDNAFLWNYETFKRVAIQLQSKYKYGTFISDGKLISDGTVISSKEPIELNVWNSNNKDGHIEVFIDDDIQFIYEKGSSFILKIEIRNKEYTQIRQTRIYYESSSELINKIFMFINKIMEIELRSY